jgi:hypothetical protein
MYARPLSFVSVVFEIVNRSLYFIIFMNYTKNRLFYAHGRNPHHQQKDVAVSIVLFFNLLHLAYVMAGESRVAYLFKIMTYKIPVSYFPGVPTCTSETTVLVKVVSSDQPVFEQQFYETWIPEDAALQSTALALMAHAQNSILYSIQGGNDQDEFAIDYQTGRVNIPNKSKIGSV